MGGSLQLVNRYGGTISHPRPRFSTGGGGFGLAQPDAGDKTYLESQLY